ncbi:MAG: hypothetical protein QXX08_09385 [Candidatus Bathyarchaeia archaeon]
MKPPAKTKEKLNVTIDKRVKQRAIAEAKRKHIPISRLIENFLEFFANPKVYCYKCGMAFYSSDSKLCTKCGWMICPKCSTCGCSIDEKTATAMFQMRRVYEDLLSGRVKES